MSVFVHVYTYTLSRLDVNDIEIDPLIHTLKHTVYIVHSAIFWLSSGGLLLLLFSSKNYKDETRQIFHSSDLRYFRKNK